MHSEDRAGQALEDRTIVGDDHADPTKATERDEEAIARGRIEVIRRLVEQEHVGLARQRGADLPAFALARRERRPSLQRLLFEREPSFQLGGDAVVRRGQLEHVGPGLVHRLRTMDDPPVGRPQTNRPLVGRELAREHPEQRRLSSAVRADQPIETRTKHERHISHYGHGRRPRDAHAVRFQHGHMHSSFSSSSTSLRRDDGRAGRVVSARSQDRERRESAHDGAGRSGASSISP
jgi:hypothetical protein